MLRRTSLSAGLAAMALAVALAGCTNDKPADSSGATTPGLPTVGKPADVKTASANGNYKLITNGISPFWNSLGKGLDAAKADLKVDGDWQGPNPANPVEQVKLFNDALAAKPDGIAVSVIDAKAFAPTIDKAMEAGVPVITFDSDSDTSKRLAYIGSNNYEAGKTAGQETLKLYPNGGKLVAFVGNMGAQNARDRYNGFKDALKNSKVEFIAEPFEDNKDKGMARKNVEDAITRYQAQGLNGLVGLYSYNGPAIVEAVKTAQMRDKMKIICFDGEPETLKNLEAGLVDVTVVQKPFEFGRLSVKLLSLIKKDKTIDAALAELKPELDTLHMTLDPVKHIIDTGVEVVTPANAPPFLKKLKEQGLEST